jgi:hypothetical protein
MEEQGLGPAFNGTNLNNQNQNTKNTKKAEYAIGILYGTRGLPPNYMHSNKEQRGGEQHTWEVRGCKRLQHNGM